MFTTLKKIIEEGGEFQIKKVNKPVYKKWDTETKKMLISNEYQEGYRKIYTVDTDKGTLDLSANQLGQCLLRCFDGIKSEFKDKTLKVNSNGKTGMEIRYNFFLKLN